MKCRRLILFSTFLALLLGLILLASPGRSTDTLGVSLPMALKGYLPFPLGLNSIWTANIATTPTTDFTGGDPVQYHASGTNSSDGPIDVDRSWALNNYCGETLIYTDTVSLDPGEWTVAITQTAPACSGVTDYTFQATYDERPFEITTPLTVTNPVVPAVWALPAFDKCDNASISEMAVWWASSPYWISNIYIGGIHRACANADLTPEWVRAVLDQGWALIPTWVGPQAPCTNYKYRFSYDLTEAYQQGRTEADAAALAAAGLGLTSFGPGNTIIYYDLEGFSEPNDDDCRDAAKSFINGWVERMRELGNPVGVYGGACSSYVSDWATIPNVPNDVWVAWWTYDEYDPDVDVENIICLSNSLWTENQRLRQYAGGHNETWGNLTLNIDSNISQGEVLALLPMPVPIDQTRLERTMLVTGPMLDSIGALSEKQAWVIADGQLYWTNDGGMNWSNRSPGQDLVQAATFLDQEHGWLVIPPNAAQPVFSIGHTADGGQSWQAAPLAPASETLLSARVVSLDFINPLEGWLSLKLASSSNFDLGLLYHTADGGLTWEERSLPGGGMIDFVSQTLGWTLAGSLSNELFQTQDGGQTWQPVGSVANAPLGLRNPLPGNLPGAAGISYVSSSIAWAFTRSGACDSQSCTTSGALWRTLDGGITWSQVEMPGSN